MARGIWEEQGWVVLVLVRHPEPWASRALGILCIPLDLGPDARNCLNSARL